MSAMLGEGAVIGTASRYLEELVNAASSAQPLLPDF